MGKGGGHVDGQEVLQEQLDTLDDTVLFLVVIIASVLLSFWATLRQRQAVCLSLQGEEEAAQRAGAVTPIRFTASALVLGALGYFLHLALRLWEDARCGIDPTSAGANLWASILVLCAAIVRWRDLCRVAASEQ